MHMMLEGSWVVQECQSIGTADGCLCVVRESTRSEKIEADLIKIGDTFMLEQGDSHCRLISV